MRCRLLAACVIACTMHASAQSHPDFQGFWTNATATPLQRPPEFKDRPVLAPAEAAAYANGTLDRIIKSLAPEDQLAADLNDIYGETSSLTLVDGGRTALIVEPPDGRLPPALPQALARAKARPPHSYDDPETLSLDERCLMGSVAGSSQVAAPIVPNLFAQNYYQIVQTSDTVVLYTEVVHDTRVIRMNGTHLPPSIRRWTGDSIGRWDGDTLVVDTTNFTEQTHFRGSTEQMHVIERFTRVDATTIRYRATVEDPDTWPQAWTIEFPFRRTDRPVLEYACHEGNYSLENSLRGHRAEEREARTRAGSRP